MENGNNAGHPPHYPPYQYPYPQAQLYPYGYQYPPAPPPSSSAAPAAPYLSPSPSFPSYAPAPPPPQQQQYHSGPLQAYPPPPQYHAYPPPPHPSPYGHGYDPYPSSPYPSSYPSTNPSPSPSPGLSPSSSFHHHQHASAPEPQSPAPSAPSYPIEDVLASMRLSDRHDYASSPSVAPPSTPFSGDGSSHGGGMQVVPYGAAAGGSQHGGGMQMVPYGAAAGGSQHGGSFRASLKVVLLHGSLDIWVHDARHLPNKDMFSKRVGELLGPRITSAVGSKMSSASMTSDPYVTVQVSYATVARTYVIPNCENPVWSQNFLVPVGHEAAEVQFVVKDSDVFGAQIIGVVSIPAEKLLTGERIQGVYPVLEPNGKPCAPGAVLHLSIQYIPVAQLTMYHHGVIAGPDSLGVPHTYFPLRRGMRVTLYQDAHVPDGCLPDIWLGNGLRYQHGQCWRDIYDAICQARKLIYIVGWSVFHTIHLVRDGTQAPSLGDLLKMKSQEGVRVLLLVWDDPTSRSILGYKLVCIIIYQVENMLL